MERNKKKISIIIPTLNAAEVLKSCLESIANQNYPKDDMEIIVSDGGSTDDTVNIAKHYGAIIIQNKLKTGEAGKAVGVRHSRGEYVALVDSDNILPSREWLNEMLIPLSKHPEAVGSEPWSYTWREEDGFITRYCALIGMNDPMVHFLGNYDRINLLTGMWTEVSHDEKDMGNYLLVKLDKRGIPTIGANGTVFKSSFIKQNISGNYLFDIDILAKEIARSGSVTFIKVKNGIVHTFCERNIGKFARKQKRRITDYMYHKNIARDRDYDWESMGIGGSNSSIGLIKFTLSCLTVFPLVYQSIHGYMKKPDTAWFFHPLACEITLWEYGLGRILSMFKKEEFNREGWSQ